LKTNLGNLHTKFRKKEGHYHGKWLSQQDEINAMMKVHSNFKNRISFRLILGAHRSATPPILDKRFDLFHKVYKENPNVVGGVDIFGPEETGRKNIDFINTLDKLKNEAKNDKSYVLSIHSGETKDIEYPFDHNLYTLSQLDKSIPVRVGHAISLWKYPLLMKMFIDARKHIEVSPLSNTILGYIDSMSNHPGLLYHTSQIPISINSDDPSYFGYNYVSFDWFLAIIEWKLQLQDVIHICLNSNRASAMNAHYKTKLRQLYTRELGHFINIHLRRDRSISKK